MRRFGARISVPRIALAFAITGFMASLRTNVSAQSHNARGLDSGEPIYDARPTDVPLQPFSLDEPRETRPSTVQVAYYIPHAIPRAEPRLGYQENDEEQMEFQMIRVPRPIASGNRALLRHGIAYAPANAPDRVKNAIWAVNTICNRPYVWGGGHGSFRDFGYDCSGAVSFALHYAGALDRPLPSSDFLRYGESGRGRWITIYSRHGHTFAVIAGLRLDTTDVRDGDAVGPRWYNDGRQTWGFQARHPAGL
jgi:hypothetical protein